ncbi:hypothetical protein ACJX0J_010195 [Zea mays]
MHIVSSFFRQQQQKSNFYLLGIEREQIMAQFGGWKVVLENSENKLMEKMGAFVTCYSKNGHYNGSWLVVFFPVIICSVHFYSFFSLGNFILSFYITKLDISLQNGVHQPFLHYFVIGSEPLDARQFIIYLYGLQIHII